MRMWSKFSVFVLILAGCLLFVDCAKDTDGDGSNVNDFDRSAMLANYAQNIIQPGYIAFYLSIQTLQSSFDQFKDNQSEGNLITLRQAWLDCYQQWMKVNSFNFGPAGGERTIKTLVEEIGVWPVDIVELENKILAGTSAGGDAKRATRGLLTLEYLLFGTDVQKTIVSFDGNRANYFEEVLTNIESLTGDVNTTWQGNYLTEFIENDGTDVGSSTSQLYNEFVRSYEAIKNFKLSIPLGLVAGQTGPEPDKVEAYYNQRSLDFLKVHFQTIIDLWYGKSASGADGIGWKEYLQNVQGGPALIEQTVAQIETTQVKLQEVPDLSLQNLIANNDPSLLALQTEMQKLTRFFKSDMSSLLGIAITFSSGDGD